MLVLSNGFSFSPVIAVLINRLVCGLICSMSYLNAIERFTGDNLGGIIELQVARVSEIDEMPEAEDGVIYGDITFKSGGGFHSWVVTAQTPRLRGDGRDSREGAYRSNRIDFVIPKDRSNIKVLLEKAEADEFIVLYKDSNGNQKIFGHIYAPVFFRFGHDTQSSISARNEYDCSFYYEGPDNNYFYEGSIPEPPTGAASVIIQWNGVTILAARPGDLINFNSRFEYTDFEINPTVT